MNCKGTHRSKLNKFEVLGEDKKEEDDGVELAPLGQISVLGWGSKSEIIGENGWDTEWTSEK